MSTPFVIENRTLVAKDVVLTQNPNARLVLLWTRAQSLEALLPSNTDLVSRDRRLDEILDTLNAAAAGGSFAHAQNELERIDGRIRSSQSALRCSGFWASTRAAGATFVVGLSILTLYWLMREVGFKDWVEDDAQSVRLNIIENIVGATGWATVGFAPAFFVRKFIEAKLMSFENVARDLEAAHSAWHAGFAHAVICLLTILAFYFGVSYWQSDFGGFHNVLKPFTSLVPGLGLGLFAPSLFKLLVDR
jgi:hypothetical protein